jgi:hypothetical protein
MTRDCFRVFSLGTDVPGVATCSNGPVGRCVSSADTSLSLSLSLSCPGSTPLLSAASSRLSRLFAGYATPYPAPCSKLPCHARNDVRRPHEVTRDRSLAYTPANVRQAHCERYCRAPGGVAVIRSVSSPHCAPQDTTCSKAFSRAPGGVAGTRSALAEIRSAPSRSTSSRSASSSHHASRSLFERHRVIPFSLVALEQAPLCAPVRAGGSAGRVLA